MKLPMRRSMAWCIDWACILGWVTATAAVGIPLYTSGLIHFSGSVLQNVVGAAMIVAPVVIAAAV